MYSPGLEGVVAVRTAIAEPDRDGGVLRYRGVDLVDLAGRVGYGDVWSLLVDGRFGAPLTGDEAPGAEPAHSGEVRADVQAGLALLSAGATPLLDTSAEQARAELARCSAGALALVARAARGPELPPVPDAEVAAGEGPVERFLLRWRGHADPTATRALDAYCVCAAEHGLNPSTFTARVVASTGADAAAALSAAVGAMSGPLHGGAPARVLPLLDAAERTGDPARVVRGVLDRSERLMGFGHRVYRAEDPRARALRDVCAALGAPRYEVAVALEAAALAELAERRPDRAIATNVEFWAAVALDLAGVPAPMMPALFTCARTAGWSAHVLEQRSERLLRPTAEYVGPPPRTVDEVAGAAPGVVRGTPLRDTGDSTVGRALG